MNTANLSESSQMYKDKLNLVSCSPLLKKSDSAKDNEDTTLPEDSSVGRISSLRDMGFFTPIKATLPRINLSCRTPIIDRNIRTEALKLGFQSLNKRDTSDLADLDEFHNASGTQKLLKLSLSSKAAIPETFASSKETIESSSDYEDPLDFLLRISTKEQTNQDEADHLTLSPTNRLKAREITLFQRKTVQESQPIPTQESELISNLKKAIENLTKLRSSEVVTDQTTKLESKVSPYFGLFQEVSSELSHDLQLFSIHFARLDRILLTMISIKNSLRFSELSNQFLKKYSE
jgi:hypothetical protein